MSKKQLNLKYIQKISIYLTVLLILTTFILLNLANQAFAINQIIGPYVAGDVVNYPGYAERIDALKAAHPNWNFTILYTDIDWYEAIRNETTEVHGRSLVPKDKTGEWLCSVCGDLYDSGKWRCASDIAVAYYMDPRNFLTEDYIFMFENLSYNATGQTIAGVQKIIEGAPYLNKPNITYTKTDGSTAVINKTYAQAIMEAAQKEGISPYHLASRIVQEQGKKENASSTGSGTYPGYVGYYNFLNINASGNGAGNIIVNALEYAKSQGYTDPVTSIEKGANFLAKSYIGRGQSTLYLQKFDVDYRDGKLYYHQYMQNIMAPSSECSSIKKSYQELGALDKNSNFQVNFLIPVYRNMPSTVSPKPKDSGQVIMDDIVTQDVEITGTNVNVRAEKSTSGTVIAKLNKGDRVVRIEKANKIINGYKWDCIVLPDGRKGYISSGYIKEIGTISNCNETVTLTGNGVYVRNGPGRDKTTVVASLSKGQNVTRIEKGKYNNIDGYNWDRIRLSDGRTGYIASNYLKLVSTAGEQFKENGTNLVCEPNVTVENIKKTYSNVVIKNLEGKTVTTGNIGTGYTMQVGDKKYTIEKTGDLDGDGLIDAIDSLRILKYAVNTYKLEGVYAKAADVNQDGAVDAIDSLAILKYTVGTYQISVSNN